MVASLWQYLINYLFIENDSLYSNIDKHTCIDYIDRGSGNITVDTHHIMGKTKLHHAAI